MGVDKRWDVVENSERETTAEAKGINTQQLKRHSLESVSMMAKCLDTVGRQLSLFGAYFVRVGWESNSSG